MEIEELVLEFGVPILAGILFLLIYKKFNLPMYVKKHFFRKGMFIGFCFLILFFILSSLGLYVIREYNLTTSPIFIVGKGVFLGFYLSLLGSIGFTDNKQNT